MRMYLKHDIPPSGAHNLFPELNLLVNGQLSHFLSSVVKKPYILITGQSDYGIPGSPNSITILNDPNLVRWFAQNLEAPHPKLVSVPIGICRFEHGPELDEAIRAIEFRCGTWTPKETGL